MNELMEAAVIIENLAIKYGSVKFSYHDFDGEYGCLMVCIVKRDLNGERIWGYKLPVTGHRLIDTLRELHRQYIKANP